MFELDRGNCPMRADNGNCLPVGGFCTAVSDIYCEIAHKSYGQGYLDNAQRTLEQPKVIRCKDCKKHGTYDCPVKDSYDGECIPYRTDDNFYCADGE